jgi:hypothetical protein
MTERVCSIRLPWRIPVCTAKCSYKLWGILQLCCSNDNKIMFHTFALHSLAGLFWVTSTTDKHNPLKIQLQTSFVFLMGRTGLGKIVCFPTPHATLHYFL